MAQLRILLSSTTGRDGETQNLNTVSHMNDETRYLDYMCKTVVKTLMVNCSVSNSTTGGGAGSKSIIVWVRAEFINEAGVGEPRAVESLDLGELVEQQGDSAGATILQQWGSSCSRSLCNAAAAAAAAADGTTTSCCDRPARTSLWLRLPGVSVWGSCHAERSQYC